MKLQLKRIDPIAAGKIMGGLYAALSLMIVPFFLLMGVFAAFAGQASMNMNMQGAGPMPPFGGIFAGMGIVFALLMPVIYGVMGFVMGALMALVYNLICRWLGGLILDFVVLDAPSPSVPVTPVSPPELPTA